MSRQRAAEIVGDAAALASKRLATRGLPALPNTTPHTLRRTYISIALLANQFDVLWVMSQVGHADSKMTMDVYAQLQQRAQREHGMAFDTLVRQARERLYGATGTPEPASLGTALGTGLEHGTSTLAQAPRPKPDSDADGAAGDVTRDVRTGCDEAVFGLGEGERERRVSGDGETRTRTGDTTIFSRVLYQLS